MIYSVNLRAVAALAAVVAPLAFAQTFTDCNPTEKSCPNVPGLAQSTYSVDLTDGVPKDWSMTSGALKTASKGGLFQINSLSDGPTIASDFSILFGSVEITMQAAPGAGVVSTFVMESTDLDEIDLEIIGSETGQVQSNYFGKGNTTSYDRGQYHPVSSPQTSFHTYKVDWKADTTKWYIDGKLVRTLAFADAVGGKNYPQTPVNIRIGNWVAGRPGNQQGTIDWAGGLADMSKAPFNMYVTKIKIQNDNPCGEYQYSDKTGDWKSIKCASGGPSVPAPSSRASSAVPSEKSSTTSVPSKSPHQSASASAHSTSPVGQPSHNDGGETISVSSISPPCEKSSTTSSHRKPSPPLSTAPAPPLSTAPASTPDSPVTRSSEPPMQTTVIVTKSTTTCPVGHTVTSGSITTTLDTPSVSTIHLTSTLTICNKCTESKTSPPLSMPTYSNSSIPSISHASTSESSLSKPAGATPSTSELVSSSSDTPFSPVSSISSSSGLLTFSAPSNSDVTISLTSTITATATATVPAPPVSTYPVGGQSNSTMRGPSGSLPGSPVTTGPADQFQGAASKHGAGVMAGLALLAVSFIVL